MITGERIQNEDPAVSTVHSHQEAESIKGVYSTTILRYELGGPSGGGEMESSTGEGGVVGDYICGRRQAAGG